MKRFKPGIPSPALIVALIALFVALGSVSYAATQLKKDSVGTKQLKKNAVNSTKVKNKSLKAVDFKPGQLPAGEQGPQGLQGAQGNTGQNGAPGISGYERITTEIPVSSTAAKTLFATCPGTKKVIGGGAKIFAAAGQVILDESYPISDNAFYGETATVGGGLVSHGLIVTAVCANVAP